MDMPLIGKPESTIPPESSVPTESTVPEFLSGGGEMGLRIRQFDWSQTSMGEFGTWPQSLRICLRIMLTSRQPIWIGWGKDLLKFYNDPYKTIVGGKHPWALGQPASVVWKEVWNDISPMLQAVMEKGEGTYVESHFLVMERNGYREETYYTFSYTPIPGDNGGTAGMICANTNDTERIIGERQLKTIQDLSNIETANKSLDDVYRSVAAALAKNDKDFPFGIIYRIKDEDLLAEPVAWVGVDRDQPYFPNFIDLTEAREGTANFYRAFHGRQIVVSENNGRRKGIPTGAWPIEATHFIHIPIYSAGKEYPRAIFSAALNPYRRYDDSFGQFASLIADQIGIEINDVLAYEAERKRSEALAEIDRAKTAFFSNISHEFRTPLTLLLGPINDLLSDPFTVDANRVRMQIARRNALRLQKLVNSLLDFSRIEAKKVRPNFEWVDIEVLTKDIATSFRSVMEKAGLDFAVDIQAITCVTAIDPEMWENILLNLLSNAFKYTLSGSVELKLEVSGSKIRLSVSDTGVGIAEHELPHIFERFHRVANVQGRTQEGSGIGLSLVKELVRLQDGDISVTSEWGKGSSFTVTLPARHSAGETWNTGALNSDKRSAFLEEARKWIAEVPGEVIGGDSVTGSKGRVLVVDDNTDMRDYITRLLAGRFEVLPVMNGKEALEAVLKWDPDLVLSDVMMPEIDGMEFLETMRRIDRVRNIPFIFLSARAGEEARVEGIRAGADDYLVKPFSARELLAKVEANIRVSRARKALEESEEKLRQLAGKLEHMVEARTSELQRSNEDLQQFAHVASHDLKEPTRKILTFSDRLRAELGPGITQKARKYIDKMEHSARRMSSMIDGVLQYSSAETIEIEVGLIDLNMVMEDVADDLEVLIQEKSGSIVYDQLPLIEGYPVLIYQLFYNLTANSLKFSRDGVPPIVRISSEKQSNGNVRIVLQDNGIGFRPDQAEDIFKVFLRLHSKDRFEGTGLGLAFCKKIVERHHGSIVAEGSEGEGAVFILILPQKPAATNA